MPESFGQLKKLYNRGMKDAIICKKCNRITNDVLCSSCQRKERISITKKRYYKKNKKRIQKYKKEWQQKNKEKIAKKQKIWRKENRQKINKYHVNRKENDVEYKLLCNLRVRLNRAVIYNGKYIRNRKNNKKEQKF